MFPNSRPIFFAILSATLLPQSVHADDHSKQPSGVLRPLLPLAFEVNRGQTDPRVDYLARGRGYTLFLTSSGAVLSLVCAAPAHNPTGRAPEPPTRSTRAPSPRISVVRFALAGASRQPSVAGAAALPGQANYLVDPDPKKSC